MTSASHATHAPDSPPHARARLASSRAREVDEGAHAVFDTAKSVTLMSQRDREIGLRESRIDTLTRRVRGASHALSGAFAGAASRLSADSKNDEL